MSDVQEGGLSDIDAEIEAVAHADPEGEIRAAAKPKVDARAGADADADADAQLQADARPHAEAELCTDAELHAEAEPHARVESHAEAGPRQTVEALLFLSPDPLSTLELAEAAQLQEDEVLAALEALAERYPPSDSGIVLRELGGGFTLASHPATENAARRLFSRPRLATLSHAQAETLAIVAYLQPISRPEITRIRGVSADSAANTLLERGLIEEAGRSQFGATMYRTSTLFLKLFGLRTLAELPDPSRWDPTPEEHTELRERLLRAGDARAGGSPPA